MKRAHGRFIFESEYVDDRVGGFGALDLFRTRHPNYRLKDEERTKVARITYWDAEGQFSVETFNGDLHLILLQELIAEAMNVMKASLDTTILYPDPPLKS